LITGQSSYLLPCRGYPRPFITLFLGSSSLFLPPCTSGDHPGGCGRASPPLPLRRETTLKIGIGVIPLSWAPCVSAFLLLFSSPLEQLTRKRCPSFFRHDFFPPVPANDLLWHNQNPFRKIKVVFFDFFGLLVPSLLKTPASIVVRMFPGSPWRITLYTFYGVYDFLLRALDPYR